MKTPYAFVFLGLLAILSSADARKMSSLVGDRAALLPCLLASVPSNKSGLLVRSALQHTF